ncbi:DUF4124 domain-containing protein [Simplicispira psychrophila]|uniref:DUF4124 domain-containing protein n=1 Tax=Simplicispira psychrophila TaxID=80882 RepID=UPI0004861EFE|nr:DUF4124 domain-containing protein [Simplicispira psychrophila]
MKMHKIFLLALAYTWSAGAFSQWQWTDKDGRKVFSDRPPPIEIPLSHILKQPHSTPTSKGTPPVADPQAAPAGPASAATPKIAPASGTDKELEEKKAKAEAAEAAQQKAQDAKNAAARADNCTRAQRAKTTFDSNRPIRQTNAEGNSVVLDANERAAEVRRIQSIIDSDCKR